MGRLLEKANDKCLHRLATGVGRLLAARHDAYLLPEHILTVFFYSTSITKTAQLLGITPMLCRARVEKAVERLKGLGHDSIYSYFQYILENLNKVKKEVSAGFAVRAPANRDYPSGRVAQTLPFAQEET